MAHQPFNKIHLKMRFSIFILTVFLLFGSVSAVPIADAPSSPILPQDASTNNDNENDKGAAVPALYKESQIREDYILSLTRVPKRVMVHAAGKALSESELHEVLKFSEIRKCQYNASDGRCSGTQGLHRVTFLHPFWNNFSYFYENHHWLKSGLKKQDAKLINAMEKKTWSVKGLMLKAHNHSFVIEGVPNIDLLAITNVTEIDKRDTPLRQDAIMTLGHKAKKIINKNRGKILTAEQLHHLLEHAETRPCIINRGSRCPGTEDMKRVKFLHYDPKVAKEKMKLPKEHVSILKQLKKLEVFPPPPGDHTDSYLIEGIDDISMLALDGITRVAKQDATLSQASISKVLKRSPESLRPPIEREKGFFEHIMDGFADLTFLIDTSLDGLFHGLGLINDKQRDRAGGKKLDHKTEQLLNNLDKLTPKQRKNLATRIHKDFNHAALLDMAFERKVVRDFLRKVQIELTKSVGKPNPKIDALLKKPAFADDTVPDLGKLPDFDNNKKPDRALAKRGAPSETPLTPEQRQIMANRTAESTHRHSDMNSTDVHPKQGENEGRKYERKETVIKRDAPPRGSPQAGRTPMPVSTPLPTPLPLPEPAADEPWYIHHVGQDAAANRDKHLTKEQTNILKNEAARQKAREKAEKKTKKQRKKEEKQRKKEEKRRKKEEKRRKKEEKRQKKQDYKDMLAGKPPRQRSTSARLTTSTTPAPSPIDVVQFFREPRRNHHVVTSTSEATLEKRSKPTLFPRRIVHKKRPGSPERLCRQAVYGDSEHHPSPKKGLAMVPTNRNIKIQEQEVKTCTKWVVEVNQVRDDRRKNLSDAGPPGYGVHVPVSKPQHPKSDCKIAVYGPPISPFNHRWNDMNHRPADPKSPWLQVRWKMLRERMRECVMWTEMIDHLSGHSQDNYKPSISAPPLSPPSAVPDSMNEGCRTAVFGSEILLPNGGLTESMQQQKAKDCIVWTSGISNELSREQDIDTLRPSMHNEPNHEQEKTTSRDLSERLLGKFDKRHLEQDKQPSSENGTAYMASFNRLSKSDEPRRTAAEWDKKVKELEELQRKHRGHTCKAEVREEREEAEERAAKTPDELSELDQEKLRYVEGDVALIQALNWCRSGLLARERKKELLEARKKRDEAVRWERGQAEREDKDGGILSNSTSNSLTNSTSSSNSNSAWLWKRWMVRTARRRHPVHDQPRPLTPEEAQRLKEDIEAQRAHRQHSKEQEDKEHRKYEKLEQKELKHVSEYRAMQKKFWPKGIESLEAEEERAFKKAHPDGEDIDGSTHMSKEEKRRRLKYAKARKREGKHEGKLETARLKLWPARENKLTAELAKGWKSEDSSDNLKEPGDPPKSKSDDDAREKAPLLKRWMRNRLLWSGVERPTIHEVVSSSEPTSSASTA
ncbi:hypothetical protein JOL62DRAFT_278962 [Phyllosticta paracitricarpa]|uniref:Uncharacterized protein n=1 Tax=Phyllosticta paracitricarpa TaxID=2016321 RepID=A0ABR1MW70_9PEZI